MSGWKLLSGVFGALVLVTLAVPARAQIGEATARGLARRAARSRLQLAPREFLGVHRDVELEESLGIATTGWRAGPVFIYRMSEAGVEVRKDAVVQHVVTDAEFTYLVAVSSADGAVYPIRGFGLAKSRAEFGKLIRSMGLRIYTADQAQDLADFYRKVNPENYEVLLVTPISSLLELKQAAERQCWTGSFDADEAAFDAWWKRAEPLYKGLSFEEKAVARGKGYLVRWIGLSSGKPGAGCGGVVEGATLEVGADGRIGKLTFKPLGK